MSNSSIIPLGLLTIIETFFGGYILFMLAELSKAVHEINLLFAEKRREKTKLYEFTREYVKQGVSEAKRYRLYFILLLLLFSLLGLLLYLKTKDYYILTICMCIIVFILLLFLISTKIYENTLARCKGIAKNPPTDFDDLLDRVEIEDEDERNKLTKIYILYEEKGLEKYKEELFDELP